MKVKTITGPSIHAALAEARRLLGDDVVLLESIPPRGDEPARITVLADSSVVQDVPDRDAEVAQPALVGYGYGARPRAGRKGPATEESAPVAETFSLERGPRAGATRALPPGRASTPAPGTGRGQLFPDASAAETAHSTGPSPSTARLEKLFEAQLQLLHERLDRMERRFDSAVIGASHQWGAHPMFGALLAKGLRPATVVSLFDDLVAQGYEPDADEKKVQWVMAHELRRRLTLTASRQHVGTELFIGPSGAGKTSLILKLATHPNFYARRRTTVITITPDEEAVPYQNPVDLYRRYGIPVQSVQTEAEMQDALDRLRDFDQVLIDTPPLPMHEGLARKMLGRVQRMVAPVMPLEVQFVLNTTRALDAFDTTWLERLPLQPTLVALTHLDETPGWGRVAEWLMAIGLPVYLVSTGPCAPDDLASFSPTWFVEKMMEL